MVTPRVVGVKFLLEGGQFFCTLTSEREARGWIRDWMSGAWKLKDTSVIGNSDGLEAWAIQVDSITCIHTFDPAQLQQPPDQNPPGPKYSSGLPN